jgi:hypothetical protein
MDITITTTIPPRIAASGLALAAALLAMLCDPSVAHACHTSTVCLYFEGPFEDVETGEIPDARMVEGEGTDDLVLAHILPARGVRLRFVPPPPELSREYFADENGCFTFESEWYTGFRVVVFPEALIGQSQNIHIEAFDNRAAFNEMPGAAPLAPWLVDVNGIDAAETMDVAIPTMATDIAMMFGMTLHVIHTLDSATTPRLSGLHSLQIATYPWTQDDIESDMTAVENQGAFGGFDRLYLNHVLVKKKFTIAHELGHWFQQHWARGTIGGGIPTWLYAEQDEDCSWADAGGGNDFHGIRSVEHAGGAISEGLAHALAAYAFDSPATADALFKYYKEVAPGLADEPEDPYYDFVHEDDYVVSMLGTNDLGGQLAWAENMCVPDFNPATNGGFEISSEIDWQRFWWQFLADPGATGPVPDLWHVFRLFYLHNPNPTLDPDIINPVLGYPDLHQIIVEDPENMDLDDFLDRFEELEAVNGVYNGA